MSSLDIVWIKGGNFQPPYYLPKSIEEVEPDEFDLQLLAECDEDDDEFISLEEYKKELGISRDELHAPN